jgi:peptidoglycan/LPS O-acetylase OafA/YrhL
VNNLKKLQFLDSLRGVAILLVLLVHSGGLAELFGHKLEVASLGQRGVQLFYEISAFSLLYSHYQRNETSNRAFFIRRFFRIAPLFYLSIVANFICSVLVARNPPLSFAAYVSGFTFLFGFHPSTINAVAPAGWSVAVEAIFYAAFPLLILFITDLGRALAFSSVSTLACFFVCNRLNIYPLSGLPSEYLHFTWFPAEFPVFTFGFVAFFVWRDLGLESGGLRKTASLCLLGFAAFVICASFPPSNYRLYVNSLSFVLLILALALHPWRILVNSVTGLIGRLSFSIYLIHPYLRDAAGTVMDWLEHKSALTLYGTWAGLGVSFSVFLFGSLSIAALTYNFVELPGIAVGKRLICRQTAQKPSPLFLRPEN